jgi:hypothetical protein
MNIEKLEALKERIKRESMHFDMSLWFKNHSTLANKLIDPACGTAACLAGHACLNEGYLHDPYGYTCNVLVNGAPKSAEATARHILGLTHTEGDRLFFTSSWPFRFRTRYKEMRDQKNFRGMAQAACDRIDHFIATEGRE